MNRACDAFRGEVVECALDVLPHDVGGVIAYRLGDAEVDELEFALDEEEIGRFQVAMDNAVFVVVNCVDSLEEVSVCLDNLCFCLGKE